MKKPLPGDKVVKKHYGNLLAGLKTRILQAQNRAVMSANAVRKIVVSAPVCG
jgi:hypothetical protein